MFYDQELIRMNRTIKYGEYISYLFIGWYYLRYLHVDLY